ncbi:MAG: aminotransferase class I/II-fold pyridoxal phosphate-dependent enzyme [Silicimonas sp.]|nr:aminotransferase class I/II-fold pyridoxal phosphate-dependent enzyme [Silicimonas sp.]
MMKRLLRAAWPESVSRPVATPLQPSVVYATEDADMLDSQYLGQTKGYTYSREGHPNAEVVANLIDEMENAAGGTVVSSGMAAVTIAILSAVKAGDHVIGADQLYGRSLRLLSDELPRLGIQTTLADPTDVNAIADAIRPDTRLVLIETVSNPTLRVADIEGIISLCRQRGILVAVDNTFTTPKLLRPLELGADIVLHSLTKMLSGHSDAMLGYVVARDPELCERMSMLTATMGVTGAAFDAWMAERGLYSFDMRFERASNTAARLADALAELPNVKRVLYPTRPDHPDHNRAVALLDGEGGNMVSFELDGGRDTVNSFVRAMGSLAFAPTLGDIATTLSHPVSSSHRALSEDARAAIGITEGFIRVSVGCEQPDDLIETFKAALS